MLKTLNHRSTKLLVAAQTFIASRKEAAKSEEGLAVVELVIILAIVAAATIAIVVLIMNATDTRAKEIKYAP
jgi:hypothetical protein